MKSITRGHIKAGLDSVRGAKWRNFWTMLGIIIGVASVISVVGIGEGIKQQVSSELHHTTNDIITIRPSALSGSNTSTLGLLSGLNITGTLSNQDVGVVRGVKGVKAVAPISAITARVSGDMGSFRSGLILGTTPQLINLLHQSLAYGNFLSSATLTNDNVVLGSKAASELFKEDVPLGQTATIDGQSFIVQGILNAFPDTPLSEDADYNSAVFIPYSIAAKLSNNTAATYEILAQVNSVGKAKQVAGAITAALTKAHGGQKDFSVLTGNQNLASNNSVLNLLTELIAGIAAISLLVGGVGIMNVMLVSVTERMHEIGIRKALGATSRQILSQFIIESTLLSFSGGVVGIIVALLIDVALRVATSLQPEISWQTVVIATVVSVLIGIIFGSVPAWKAAQKDPITALRAE